MPESPPDSGQVVPLREYLEAKIADAIRIIVTRLDAMEQARELRSSEVERRLDDLNHAHAEAANARASFVNREVYEQVIRSLQAQVSMASQALATVKRDVWWMLTLGGAVWAVIVMGLARLLR